MQTFEHLKLTKLQNPACNPKELFKMDIRSSTDAEHHGADRNLSPDNSLLSGEGAAIRRGPADGNGMRETPRRTRRATALSGARRAIALIDGHDFTRGCIATCLDVLCADTAVTAFSTVADFIAAGPHAFGLIVYHAHGAGTPGEAGNGVLAALKQAMEPTPVVVVSEVDDFDTMLEALTAGARGYIPTASTSLEVTIEVMRLVRAGGTFAPVNTSAMKARSQRVPAAASFPADRFTPRQLAVLDHLKQGKANKAIAHELAMSEGTVKVHVRNLMKKLKATNRTQAVFRAYGTMVGNSPASLAGAELTCSGQ